MIINIFFSFFFLYSQLYYLNSLMCDKIKFENKFIIKLKYSYFELNVSTFRVLISKI